MLHLIKKIVKKYIDAHGNIDLEHFQSNFIKDAPH